MPSTSDSFCACEGACALGYTSLYADMCRGLKGEQYARLMKRNKLSAGEVIPIEVEEMLPDDIVDDQFGCSSCGG